MVIGCVAPGCSGGRSALFDQALLLLLLLLLCGRFHLQKLRGTNNRVTLVDGAAAGSQEDGVPRFDPAQVWRCEKRSQYRSSKSDILFRCRLDYSICSRSTTMYLVPCLYIGSTLFLYISYMSLHRTCMYTRCTCTMYKYIQVALCTECTMHMYDVHSTLMCTYIVCTCIVRIMYYVRCICIV